ncbi:adenosylcobinamide-phosphate synthase CbiB [Limnochorda pilosa]|uniref:Cobalamin biosynthesis protein CobD n=1 Tax=Limnochorda pilosa TaxID=1555112 RepID=A0A0K2SQC3_LIMPI|nr:adenosylcobinamide-phosphate synthase CbiB [Limnochorda pilosa]BAS29328.1 cobalamin biosynthesis protein [Limnochorda pilosa]
MIEPGILPIAYLLDRLVGDPAWLPHPVRMVGRTVPPLEHALRRLFQGPTAERLAGFLLLAVLAGATWALAWLLLTLTAWASPWAARFLEAWLVAATLAPRGLAAEARAVHRELAAGRLEGARRRVAGLVGRETSDLPEAEVVRAAVESVGENLVDAVTAPLLYAALGGAPLALAYRTVNTLDALVGHPSARYRFFGWASARADDLLNYLPARLTVPMVGLTAALLGLDGPGAWRAAVRDGRRHPSPNAGLAEAAFAGALGVRLGGWNRYEGVPHFRPYLGDLIRPLERARIQEAIRLMEGSGLLVLVLLLLVLSLFSPSLSAPIAAGWGGQP